MILALLLLWILVCLALRPRVHVQEAAVRPGEGPVTEEIRTGILTSRPIIISGSSGHEDESWSY